MTSVHEPHTHEIVTNFVYSADGQSWHTCKKCGKRFSIVPPNKPLEDTL